MVLLENDAVSYHNDSYVRFVTFYACTVLDRANAHIHKEQNIRLSLPDDEEILWSNETDLKESRGDKK
jgi:hypothetical protein